MLALLEDAGDCGALLLPVGGHLAPAAVVLSGQEVEVEERRFLPPPPKAPGLMSPRVTTNHGKAQDRS